MPKREPMHESVQSSEKQRSQSRAENLALSPLAARVQLADRPRTYEELYHEAQEKGIKGRSRMSKAELEKRLSH